MQYKELSERLAKVGRPIPALGLRRIEAGERRVDVDDLVALAVVLGVAPLTLLLPRDGSARISSEMTGVPRPIGNNVQWLWATGQEPLTVPSDVLEDERQRQIAMFATAARPPIDERTVAPAIAEFRREDESDEEFEERLITKMMERFISQGIVATRASDGDD